MPNQYMPKRLPIVPIGPGIAYLPLTKGLYAIIDSHRTEDVRSGNWRASYQPRQKSYYAMRVTTVDGKASVTMLHSFLLGLKGRDLTADHALPGNGLNCLPHNLRKADRFQQASNRRMRKTNKTGCSGVSVTPEGRFRVSVTSHGIRVNVGTFLTLAEAINERTAKAMELHGKFART